MKRTSLADAKAHLSALVSAAQHRGRRTLILRHGRPSAAIVPVDVASAPSPPRTSGTRRRLSPRQVDELLRGLGRGSKRRNAVADLLASRR